MQRRTAQLILAALENKRDEDTVSERHRRKQDVVTEQNRIERLQKGLERQKEIDDRMERLAGY